MALRKIFTTLFLALSISASGQAYTVKEKVASATFWKSWPANDIVTGIRAVFVHESDTIAVKFIFWHGCDGCSLPATFPTQADIPQGWKVVTYPDPGESGVVFERGQSFFQFTDHLGNLWRGQL